MRRLITTGNVSSQSWPSTNTAVTIQAKSSTPSSAPTSATITFCPSGIALGDMLVAENRDSLSSVFISKSELQYTYTVQSGEVEIANTGNLVLWPDEKVYYGNPNSANNEVATKGDLSGKQDVVSGLHFSGTNTQKSIYSDQTVAIGSDGDILLEASNIYLGSNTVDANKVASKGYVDNAIANSTNTVITTMTIVGNVNASTNRVYFKSDGPLSGYASDAGRLTFSDPLADSNLTELVNSTNGLYIHIGYAFVVTTAGTIYTPEGNVSLSVGDIILFKNDYPNETTDSTFKWYKI